MSAKLSLQRTLCKQSFGKNTLQVAVQATGGGGGMGRREGGGQGGGTRVITFCVISSNVVSSRVVLRSTVTHWQAPAEQCKAGAEVDFTEPVVLVLTSLADGPKHGYALAKDIESFAGIKLGPGTLYGALSRLEDRGWIEALPAEDRRRPYQITSAGAVNLALPLPTARQVAATGLRPPDPELTP